MALADNKVKIQALLAGINALPAAGSGGPGGVSTCTVTILNDQPGFFYYSAAYQTESGFGTVEDDGETTLLRIECAAPSIMFLLTPSNTPTLSGDLEMAMPGGVAFAIYVEGDGEISIT